VVPPRYRWHHPWRDSSWSTLSPQPPRGRAGGAVTPLQTPLLSVALHGHLRLAGKRSQAILSHSP